MHDLHTGQWVWLIPVLPLVGALLHAGLGARVIAALGDKRGRWLVGAVATGLVLASFAVSCVVLSDLVANGGEHRRALAGLGPGGSTPDWIKMGTVHLRFEALVDPLSMLMCLIVTGVGGLIHLYATGYMATDRDYPRFFTYFNLFIFMMLVLVLGSSAALMFVGWEGVGLCSYLLISFWFEDPENAKAGNKAFIVNRIGDVGFLLGMMTVFSLFGTLSFRAADGTGFLDLAEHGRTATAALTVGSATLISLLFFVGACGKSAQFPLYIWLPDAMAGPTPVSALIHAATMVTAGVVMVTRLSPIFAQAPSAMMVVAAIGLFTAVLAAGIAAVQNDIKKVLAYSTVSQLGYMFLGCGVGAFAAGMFHVTTHAFFKALLFLGAGSVIHAMSGEQDMRKMGGLAGRIRVTHGTMVAGWLAIAGIPVFSGFWSKDLILNSALGAPRYGLLLYAVGVGTALLTAFYMTRLMAKTFWTPQRFVEPHGDKGHGGDDGHGHGHGGVHESPRSMTVPLIVLAALSVVGGLVGTPWANAFEHFLEPSVASRNLIVPHEGMPAATGLLVGALVAALGVGFGLHAYRTKGKSGFLADERTRSSNPLFIGATNLWYIDGTLSRICIGGGGQLADRVWRWADRMLIDGAVNAVAWVTGAIAEVVRRTQSGYLRSYAVTMLVGAAVVVAWVLGGSVRP